MLIKKIIITILKFENHTYTATYHYWNNFVLLIQVDVAPKRFFPLLLFEKELFNKVRKLTMKHYIKSNLDFRSPL